MKRGIHKEDCNCTICFWERNPRQLPDKQLVEGLYIDKRLDVKDICEKLDVSRAYFYEILEALEIPFRKRIPWNKGLDASDLRVKDNCDRAHNTTKKLYSNDPSFREKLLNNLKKANKKLCQTTRKQMNKKESLLNKILHTITKDYKFVGNSKVVIENFNPDFINTNGQKKIIEMYGNYWHNLPSYKKRDKRRLKSYKKYGYDTLIVWEKELQNKKELKKKLLNFV